MRILLLMGGDTEREVSLMSGEAVYKSLKALGHHVIKQDSKDFKLLSYEDYKVDLIFNALHGGIGENGVLQGFFDVLEIPYTGSGVLASSLAMNKIFSKIIFARSGIKVARDKLVDLEDLIKKDPMTRPYVLKPVDGGSSVGVNIIDDSFDINSIDFKNNKTSFFAEQFIEGREISAAIIDSKVLGLIEIQFSENFYNYNAKYKDSNTKYYVPNNISDVAVERLKEYALKAHNLLGCKGLTRADFILPHHQPNDPVLLEINTLPGLTNHSLVPKIANNSGLSYNDLISKILHGALA